MKMPKNLSTMLIIFTVIVLGIVLFRSNLREGAAARISAAAAEGKLVKWGFTKEMATSIVADNPAGWDPKHPRLSRNPNWYPGRGKERAKNVFKYIGDTIKTVPEVAVAAGFIDVFRKHELPAWDDRNN